MKNHGRRYLLTGEIRVSDEMFTEYNSIGLKRYLKKAVEDSQIEDGIKWSFNVQFIERY